MTSHRFCSYEGEDYVDFWKNREYENRAETKAMNKLLPDHGDTLVDLGCGYGRMVHLYSNYARVILLDRARSQLEEAGTRVTSCNNTERLQGDVYRIPLADASVDVAVMVRVIHHIEEPLAVFREVRRLVRPDGRFILQYANKRNLIAVLRYLTGRQERSPFSTGAVRTQELTYNFHPTYIKDSLNAAGFEVDDSLAVSYFRWEPLYSRVPPHLLARLDGVLQRPGAPLTLTPSVFISAIPA